MLETSRQPDAARKCQIVVPVYNEGDAVLSTHEALCAEQIPFDSLKFVYDFDEDTSVPFIRQLQARDPRVAGEKNGYGRGALNALKWGFAHCGPGPVIVIMGDRSDKLSIIPAMLREWESGATVVCPSRYMPGGRQHGGGLLKSTLSRWAGTSLKLFGFPTSDPTNSFKLYDGEWLRRQTIESEGGFEVSLELSYKAFVQGERIVDIPSEWWDRRTGKSQFRLLKWLPLYLRWYFRAIGALLGKRPTGRKS